jgi:hypothetical protein
MYSFCLSEWAYQKIVYTRYRLAASKQFKGNSILLGGDYVCGFAEAGFSGRKNLQLYGHTHCGQIRIPGTGAIVLPRWGEMYVKDLYRGGASQVYTSRGIAMVRLPFRFNCPPEVTGITLAQGEPCVSNFNDASEVAPQINERTKIWCSRPSW